VQSARLLVVGLALLTVGLGGLVGLGAIQAVVRWPPRDAVTRGAWIYRTGTDVDGRPIAYAGGMMMRLSCADCHGIDGRGLRSPLFLSPDITYRNLTDPAGMLEPDGARGPRYTDDAIRRAVTQGVDAEGKPLAWPMPRWRLSEQQWQALLAYLKTLP
jgi:cytochrome c oxidase subunit 2